MRRPGDLKPSPGSRQLERAVQWGGPGRGSAAGWPSGPPGRDPHGEGGLRRGTGRRRSRPPPLQAAPPAAAAATFLGPGRPGRPGRRRRRRCEAGGGPGRPPPRRRGWQRGGVCAPRDASSETPRGPSQPLVCGDRPAPGRGLPGPYSPGRPDCRGPVAASPAARPAPPSRARAPAHAGSPPPRGDALDLAVAADRPTGPSDPGATPGFWPAPLVLRARSWAPVPRPPQVLSSPGPHGLPQPAPGAPASHPGGSASSRGRRPPLSCSRSRPTRSAGSSTPCSVTTLFPPTSALPKTPICASH